MKHYKHSEVQGKIRYFWDEYLSNAPEHNQALSDELLQRICTYYNQKLTNEITRDNIGTLATALNVINNQPGYISQHAFKYYPALEDGKFKIKCEYGKWDEITFGPDLVLPKKPTGPIFKPHQFTINIGFFNNVWQDSRPLPQEVLPKEIYTVTYSGIADAPERTYEIYQNNKLIATKNYKFPALYFSNHGVRPIRVTGNINSENYSRLYSLKPHQTDTINVSIYEQIKFKDIDNDQVIRTLFGTNTIVGREDMNENGQSDFYGLRPRYYTALGSYIVYSEDQRFDPLSYITDINNEINYTADIVIRSLNVEKISIHTRTNWSIDAYVVNVPVGSHVIVDTKDNVSGEYTLRTFKTYGLDDLMRSYATVVRELGNLSDLNNGQSWKDTQTHSILISNHNFNTRGIKNIPYYRVIKSAAPSDDWKRKYPDLWNYGTYPFGINDINTIGDPNNYLKLPLTFSVYTAQAPNDGILYANKHLDKKTIHDHDYTLDPIV